MGEKRGMQALEFWCKRVTAGYPGVCVQNMTSSWRDGLAFCALIHHFRPDLLDFEKLSKENVYKNNALAFSVAEQHLGIPALLDPEDMVEYAVPDRLSILTYLSQFYQVFGNQQTPTKVGSSPAPVSLKRTTTTSEDLPPTPTKVFAREVSSVSPRRLEPCLVCKLPVFLAERLLVNNKLHHRTCFRCARCRHQLNLANYYETEQGAFCCETCPDEEPTKPIPSQGEGDESILRVETEANKVLSRHDGEAEEEKEEKERKEAARQSVQNLIARFQTEKVAMVNPLPRPSIRSAFLQEMTNVENVNTDGTESSNVVAASTLEEKPSVAEEETPLPPVVSTEAPFVPESDEKEAENDETKHLEAGNEQAASQIETSDALDDQEAPNPFEDDLEESVEGEPDIKPPNSCQEDGSNGEQAPKEEIHEDILSDDAVTLREAGDEHRIVKQEIDTSVEASVSAETEEGHISLTETVMEEQVGEVDNNSVNPLPKPPRRSKFLHLTDLPLAEATPVPSPRHSRVKPIPEQQLPPLPTPESSNVVEQYPDDLNPFEDDEAGESQVASKKKLIPLPSTMSIPSPSDFQNTRPFESGKKVIPAPSISLNPFGSDAEDDEEDNESIFSSPKPPQRPPLPAILAQGSATVKPEALPTPSPKRAAPKPPLNDSGKGKSPVGTLRLKKDRPAPPPPVLLAKTEKEMNNMSLQSKSAGNDVIIPPSKDTFGQWKRKKGPAPPRPLPQKRQLRKLPLKEVQQELQDIEVKQQELERQGVALEKSIRNLTETEIEGGGLTLEAEDMILQLFDLVNEKNDLLRRQAELMYLRRQQRLEEEHVELEFQIRCLMEKPPSERTEQDLVREDELIQRLVTVVQKRSEIVDCLEMDRKREVEEDHSIQHHMDLYVAKNTQPPTPSSSIKSPSLKTKTLKLKSPAKLFKKDKKKKKDDSNLKAKPEDADKDVDDSVPIGGVAVEVKEKKDSKDFKKVKWLPRKA